MTKVTTPRRERKKAAARERIISTAIELFSRHGLDSVTVEHIADVADLGKGTIYNYFQTKEDIIVAYMAAKEEQLQAKVAKLAESRATAENALLEYLRYQFRAKSPYHQFVRVFMAQMFQRTETFMPYMVEMQKVIDPNLHLLFSRLRERGRIRTDVSISDLIVVFKTIHLGLNALWAIEGPPFLGTEHVMKHEIRIFCEGLAPKRT